MAGLLIVPPVAIISERTGESTTSRDQDDTTAGARPYPASPQRKNKSQPGRKSRQQKFSFFQQMASLL